MKNKYPITGRRILLFSVLLNMVLATSGCSQRTTHTDSGSPGNLTVIVSSPDTFHYYHTGKKPQTRQVITKQELVNRLKKGTEKWGDSILTTIKPTAHAGWNATLLLVDDFKRNRMGRFEFASLTEKEKQVFAVQNLAFEPWVTGTGAPSGDTAPAPVYHHFYIEIRADSSVWYQPVAPEIRTRPLKMEEPVKANLKKAISEFEQMYPGIKKSFVIKGHRNTAYATFEVVVEALKESHIYNYQLETTQE